MKYSYAYYRDVLSGFPLPLAFVDLDRFDENIDAILDRAGSKKVRIATKSLRCRALIDRIHAASRRYQGLMSYSAQEAAWLCENGHDDILVAYPEWRAEGIEAVCRALGNGKNIMLTIDCVRHVRHLNDIGRGEGLTIPLCIDMDVSCDFPGIHFGVWRSGLKNVKEVAPVLDAIEPCPHVRLEALMGYEAQIAGVADKSPYRRILNPLIRLLKRRSIPAIAKRRLAVVQNIRDRGHAIPIVNGGGTGSLESTREDRSVTEVTAGSGFFAPGLFDDYLSFHHSPAAAFAIEITRMPQKGIFTCNGGGYVASGAAGKEKLPKPYLPEGLRLVREEGAGEVQTPFRYEGGENLNLGDPVFLRHANLA